MILTIDEVKHIDELIGSPDSEACDLGYKMLLNWDNLTKEESEFIQWIILNPFFDTAIAINDTGWQIWDSIDEKIGNFIGKKHE